MKGMNMKQWAADQIAADKKKAIPVLSFPAVSLLDISVEELISNAATQAKGMEMIAERVDSGAVFSMMNLSLEAEAFGSEIVIQDGEVPTVYGSILKNEEDAKNLVVPEVGAARTGLYIETIEHVLDTITDRPVFAGVIGPFSLAGRLMDVAEILINCITEPDFVNITMRKTTDFLKEYIRAYKEIGANGVVIAEPLTGLLSADLADEFSTPYMKEIVDELQDDNFMIIYHNCGNYVLYMIDTMLKTGAMGYHFGNVIEMRDMMPHIPEDIIAMGNIDPATAFKNGTPASVYEKTTSVLKDCAKYPNFIISSGCDIPPKTKWSNIDSFFKAVRDFYS